MPFKSEKQRKYLFANEPELAKKWSNMYGKKIVGLGSLTKKEMMEIIKKGEISKLSQKDKKQLFEFAFGKSYMKSSDKGKKKKYKEIKRITGLGGVKSKKTRRGLYPIYEVKHKGKIYKIGKDDTLNENYKSGFQYDVYLEIQKNEKYKFLKSFETKKESMKFIAKQK